MFICGQEGESCQFPSRFSSSSLEASSSSMQREATIWIVLKWIRRAHGPGKTSMVIPGTHQNLGCYEKNTLRRKMKKYKDPLKRFLYSLLCPGTEIWDVDGLGGIPVEIQRVLGTPSWPMFFFFKLSIFTPLWTVRPCIFFFTYFCNAKVVFFFL